MSRVATAKLRELGMDDFITKPIEANELFFALMELLNSNAEFVVPPQRIPALPNLFIEHCSNVPAKLLTHLDRHDEVAFIREIHSMVSLLALLNEQELHHRFREFERGLNMQLLNTREVFEDIRSVWPALVLKYSELSEISTPTQGITTTIKG